MTADHHQQLLGALRCLHKVLDEIQTASPQELDTLLGVVNMTPAKTMKVIEDAIWHLEV